MSNRATAHRLAASRLSIFPAHPVTKAPLVRFTAAATTGAGGVDYFWSRYGADALPAINLSGCGLIVIDLDRGHVADIDGIAEFDKLLDQHGELPICPTVRTPRGGCHIYFRQPAGRDQLGNSASRVAPGIDVRGRHGFTVAPGAVMADGQFYAGIAGTPDLADAFAAGAIPELPAWLADLAAKPDVPERGPVSHTIAESRLRSWALSVLEGEAAEMAAAPVGTRNSRLNKAAFVIASKGGAHAAISEGEAWSALWSACATNGYLDSTAAGDGATAFERSFYSGWNDGLAKPSAGPRERLTTIDPNFCAGLKSRTV